MSSSKEPEFSALQQRLGLKIIGAQCPFCKDRVFSFARHDFRQCSCGKTFVDGGFSGLGQRVGFAPDGPSPAIITPTDQELFEKSHTILWRTHEGSALPLGQLQDSHLVNIVFHTRQRSSDGFAHYAAILILFERGYVPEKLGSVQIPFEREGGWWNIDPISGMRVPAEKPDVDSILNSLKFRHSAVS